MKSLFFFDTETSGLDPSRHCILQIAWMIEKNGAVMIERVFDIIPPSDRDFNIQALECNGFTSEKMKKGISASLMFKYMHEDIKQAVGGGGPLIPCGHNVKFDIDFLHSLACMYNENWWLHFGDNGYLELKKPVCTLAMSNYLNFTGKLNISKHKLESLCKEFNIHNDAAHDALGDVRATRQVFHKLQNLIHPVRDQTHVELSNLRRSQ